MGKAVVIAQDADERQLLMELLAEVDVEAVAEIATPSGVEDPALILTDLGARYDPAKARAAVRRLRERWPAAPVLLLTSHRAAMDESDRLGADALVLKPFDVDDLMDAVRLLLSVRAEKPAPEPRLRSEA
jgi:DNA-binding NarL/FixJ family response regulator